MTIKVKRVLLIEPPYPKGKIVLRDHMGKFGVMEEKTTIIRLNKFPPLSLAYSGALLEKNGFEVNIIDSPTLDLKKSQILETTLEYNPDLIFVNTSGISLENDIEFASWLKKNSKMEVILLTYVFSPENILKKGNIGLFVRGEPEYTVLDLCENYPDYKKVKGLFYRTKGKFFYNPKRPLIKDLDELPFPAYHLLPMDKYSYSMFKKKNFTTFLSSRGCSFGCIYCPYAPEYDNKWRGKSSDKVVKELKILADEYNVKSILFRDQVFNMNPKRTEEICDGIINSQIKIEWRFEGRIDILSEKLLDKLKKAGCVGIHVGIESGDPLISKQIAKGGFQKNTMKKTKKMIDYAKKIGIEILTFFMIGFPGETKESISKTFEWAKELKPNRAWFGPVTPYPGTKLYEIAEKKGWLLSKDIKDYDSREPVMRTDDLTQKEIKDAVETANLMFSSDNKRLLRTVFSWKGIYSAIKNPKKAFKFTFGRILKKLR
jgi:radical SAM superfamily enzyme YgiQ (UPF0313 family)